jgi:protein TonB
MRNKNDLTYQLFEGKNKAYGAFALRQLHNRNVIIGWSIGVVLVAMMFVIPWLRMKAKLAANDDPIPVRYHKIISYSELSAPPPIEAQTQPKIPLEAVPIKQVKYVKPVVMKDEDVLEEELLPTMEELSKTSTGYENVEGVDSVAFEPVSLPVEPPSPKAEEPFQIVEEMPTFPGGQEALMRYLAENTQYPQNAREAGIKGPVYVQFVVNKQGQVEQAEVLRGIGFGCDEEAIRVVSSVPDWTPGRQRNRAVPVKMVVTIRFTLIE